MLLLIVDRQDPSEWCGVEEEVVVVVLDYYCPDVKAPVMDGRPLHGCCVTCLVAFFVSFLSVFPSCLWNCEEGGNWRGIRFIN